MKKTFWVCAILLLAGLHQADAQVSFAPAANYTVGRSPYSVVAADVNGNGKIDLISANMTDGTLSILTNGTDEIFGSNATLNVGSGSWSGAKSVAAADINGDGAMDLICANIGGYSNSVFISGNTLSVFTNNGSGDFGSNATLNVGSQPFCVITADVNGDGKPDLICANNTGNSLMVLTNNGTGGFVLSALMSASSPISVVAADINGDGKPDLIYVNRSSVVVFTNKGSGTFAFASSFSSGNGPIDVTAADVNGDGKVDLITADYDGNTLTVLTNDGSGNFARSATVPVGNNPYSVVAANVNGTGKPDLICANINSGSLTVLTNDGSGGFLLAATLTVGSAPITVVAADVNGDGKPDLICANYGDGTLSVLINTSYQPHAARATPIMDNGFVVAASIVDAGYAYTNPPTVYIVGGGGSGAQATTTISNGNVTAINIINAGYGYSGIPSIFISPPFVTPTFLGMAPALRLDFANLIISNNYQLQVSQSGTWINLGSPFVASANFYSQFVDGDGSSYQLALLPIPTTATATAQVEYGFVVGASVTSGGAGYVSVPSVQIIGGGGSGAQATATISDGVVSGINVTNAGFGYTGIPTIQIAPPASLSYSTLLPVTTKSFRLNYSGLTPALTFQLQSSPDLASWTNFGEDFTATNNFNSQYFNFTTNSQFFRLSLPSSP